jgi:twitching motility protein PilT
MSIDFAAVLNDMVGAKASDLHLSPGVPPAMRVRGQITPMEKFGNLTQQDTREIVYSILNDSQRKRFENDRQLDLAYSIPQMARFRVNVFFQRGAISAAFRLIPSEILDLQSLGLPAVMSEFTRKPRGFILVTGPTGSGKSTTLASMIDMINQERQEHILTIEDPIEFLHRDMNSSINQREVGADTGSFGQALRRVLRQDPDVILIGELRDLETISVALTAAETGHLVFATLHTQDAPQTIDRIIDVFPPHQQGQVRAQLAATLRGVVCQTLVKKIGGGRAVATEVLMTTPAVANLIREGKTHQVHSAMQAGRDLGMHTMDQHLADLVNAGQVTYESALEKVHDEEVLKRLVTRMAPVTRAGANFGDNF